MEGSRLLETCIGGTAYMQFADEGASDAKVGRLSGEG